VASGDWLDGGADVRAHLLVGVGVVYLRHFLGRFKTAGESPIYELHGGDPFAVWSKRWEGHVANAHTSGAVSPGERRAS